MENEVLMLGELQEHKWCLIRIKIIYKYIQTVGHIFFPNSSATAYKNI